MIFDAATNLFRLSTGKTLYAHGGVLGVARGTAWEGGARRVDTPLTDNEKWEVLEEVLTEWYAWAHVANPRVLAQLAISFGDHVRSNTVAPTQEEVTIPKATYARILAQLAERPKP